MALNPSGIPSRAGIQAAIDEAAAKGDAAAALIGGKVQHGTFTLTVGTATVTQNVTFPAAYTSAPRVFCTVIDTAAIASATLLSRWGSSTSDTSGSGDLTGFTYKASRNSGSAPIRINWWAIG